MPPAASAVPKWRSPIRDTGSTRRLTSIVRLHAYASAFRVSGGGMTAHNADFIAKLRQIEELAAAVHGELPQSLLLLRTRIQHIVVLTKTLRGRLEFGPMAIVRVERGAPSPGEPDKPPA